MVLPADIEGYDVSRIFIDGGSSINLNYADMLRKMNISLANLEPTHTRFHGITPEKLTYLLGKTSRVARAFARLDLIVVWLSNI
jgi:hypothetical protein